MRRCWSRCCSARCCSRLRNAALGRDTYGIGSGPLLAAWCGALANSFVIDSLHWRALWLIAGLIWAGTRGDRRAKSALVEGGARGGQVVRRRLAAGADDDHAERLGVEAVEHLAGVEDRVQREAVEAADEQHVVQRPREAEASRRCRGSARESTST